jgi:hypothetical protein
MSLDTYDGLVAEVQDWLFGRSDIAAKAPTFIRMLEAKANRKLMVRQMETRARATVDINSDEPEFISLPGDFQTMRRVRLPAETGKPRLEFKTSAQLDELRDSNSDRTGTPQCFTVAGDEMELWPTPSTAIEIEMTYRCNLPALGDNEPTNWLLVLAPDVYLYGALMEAAPYLHEDERIATWANGLQGAFDDLGKLSEQATFNAGPLTVRRRGKAY